MINLEHLKTSLNNRYILIATSNSVEKKAVNAVLHARKTIKIIPANLGCYIGLIGDHLTIHISGSSGTVAQNSIGRCITEFISDSLYPNPQILIMSGFCWGNPNKAVSGEVIISNTIYSLNSNNDTSWFEHPEDGMTYIEKFVPDIRDVKFYKLLHTGYDWDDGIKDYWNKHLFSPQSRRWIRAK